MATYRVKSIFRISETVEVEADSEEAAILEAENQSDVVDARAELLDQTVKRVSP